MSGRIYPVVLAAGGSTRMGSAKQLLAYKGQTLLGNALAATRGLTHRSLAAAPVVVLGADAAAVTEAVDLSGFEVLINEGWQSGMASSIKLAVLHVASKPEPADGVIFLLADQPFLSVAILKTLLQKHEEKPKAIVASRFEDSVLGPPVYFGCDYFEKLLSLSGDVGARKIIEANREHVEVVDFALGSFDIDTEQDYKKLLAGHDA